MIESNVKSYCKSFPVEFHKAKNEFLYTKDGVEYLDFFAGAGALNYGHNNSILKKELLAYIENDYITHGLDFKTSARNSFLNTFKKLILEPKALKYRVQFTSPSGTNANEAALKIAKKYTGRRGVFCFTGAFHGMSEASLAITGNRYFRDGIPMSSSDVTFIPYEQGFLDDFDSIRYLKALLSDGSSGVDVPAAIILETVQAEGGVNVASSKWLIEIREICDKYKILMIVDDIQVGCGRTGEFFSFEKAGVVPDLVTLSKSISGYGLPMSLVLISQEIDCLNSAQHNGTFRGNQHAFVTAERALKLREENNFEQLVAKKSKIIFDYLHNELFDFKSIIVRGRGMIIGIDLGGIDPNLAKQVSKICFKKGLLIECAGRKDETLKILPSLLIEEKSLLKGLSIIVKSIKEGL
jgi:diaminobutyrate-2-oxoglutarate transaminase